MGLIHQLMPEIKQEIGPIAKGGKHAQGYAYRKIEDVLNAVSPIFDRHKITTAMTCTDITTTQQAEEKKNTQGVVIGVRYIDRVVCRVAVTFHATDGSSIECSGVGEGIGYGDGTAAKKAMSAGWKYAVAMGLSIPFEAEDDEQNDPHRPASPPADKPKTPSLSQMLNGEPAATTTTTATTAAANESDSRADAMEVNVNDPCLPHQRTKVIELWEKLGRTKDQLREAIAKKGKAKLADLTVAEASELIEALCKKLGIANCPF